MLSQLLDHFRKSAEPRAPIFVIELHDDVVRYSSLKPSVDPTGAPYVLHASGCVYKASFPDETLWTQEAQRQVKNYLLKKSVVSLLLASEDYRLIQTRKEEIVHAPDVRAQLHCGFTSHPEDYVVDVVSQCLETNQAVGVLVKKSILNARLAQASTLGLKPHRIDLMESSVAALAATLAQEEQEEQNTAVLSKTGQDFVFVVQNRGRIVQTHRMPEQTLRVINETENVTRAALVSRIFVDAGQETDEFVNTLSTNLEQVVCEPLHPYSVLAEEVADLFSEQQLLRHIGTVQNVVEQTPGVDWQAQYDMPQSCIAKQEVATGSDISSLRRITQSNEIEQNSIHANESESLDCPLFEQEPVEVGTEPNVPDFVFANKQEQNSPQPYSSEPIFDFPPLATEEKTQTSQDDGPVEPHEQVVAIQDEKLEPASMLSQDNKSNFIGPLFVFVVGLVAQAFIVSMMLSGEDAQTKEHALEKQAHEKKIATLQIQIKELELNKKQLPGTITTDKSPSNSVWMSRLAQSTPEGLWFTSISVNGKDVKLQGMTRNKAIVSSLVNELNTSDSALTGKFKLAQEPVFDTTHNLWTFQVQQQEDTK